MVKGPRSWEQALVESSPVVGLLCDDGPSKGGQSGAPPLESAPPSHFTLTRHMPQWQQRPRVWAGAGGTSLHFAQEIHADLR